MVSSALSIASIEACAPADVATLILDSAEPVTVLLRSVLRSFKPVAVAPLPLTSREIGAPALIDVNSIAALTVCASSRPSGVEPSVKLTPNTRPEAMPLVCPASSVIAELLDNSISPFSSKEAVTPVFACAALIVVTAESTSVKLTLPTSKPFTLIEPVVAAVLNVPALRFAPVSKLVTNPLTLASSAKINDSSDAKCNLSVSST
ncbi:hypothetical protein IMCC1989_2455 [gamma proteobacterium IMCC1989]|nr:hypothetical protein IMCC1989_2455 [gamma proteobacterium IMCC1989]